jgi:uncharacterized glyoxalase superfamily protein PhnB
MNAHTPVAGRTLVPTLRYRDVPAAIAWLCKAFGFEKHLVVTGDDGSIRYAQLTFGEGMIMVVPVEDTAFDQLMKQPEEAGGAETQICYLFVEDVGAHYTRAKAMGAEILLDLDQGDSSGRGYSCRDLEGHIWNFGTYDPWRRPEAADDDIGPSPAAPRRLKNVTMMAGLFLITIALGVAIGFSYGPAYQGVTETAAAAVSSDTEAPLQLERERRAREAAEQAAAAAREQLARERAAREQAERASKEAEARAARAAKEQTVTPPQPVIAARADKASVESREKMQQAQREAEAARQLLALEQKAREAAEEMAKESRDQIARERAAREAAERAAKEVREKAAKLRARRYRAYQASEAANMPWPNNTWE